MRGQKKISMRQARSNPDSELAKSLKGRLSKRDLSPRRRGGASPVAGPSPEMSELLREIKALKASVASSVGVGITKADLETITDAIGQRFAQIDERLKRAEIASGAVDPMEPAAPIHPADAPPADADESESPPKTGKKRKTK
jgi:hypothetical protein